MKSHVVLSSARKPETSIHLVPAYIPLVIEDSLPYKSLLLDSLPVAGCPRIWLQLKESSVRPENPLLVPVPQPGSQETELEWMLGVNSAACTLSPPGAHCGRRPWGCPKRWELVIIIWGLGMPTATNGPGALPAALPPGVERKTSW